MSGPKFTDQQLEYFNRLSQEEAHRENIGDQFRRRVSDLESQLAAVTKERDDVKKLLGEWLREWHKQPSQQTEASIESSSMYTTCAACGRDMISCPSGGDPRYRGYYKCICQGDSFAKKILPNDDDYKCRNAVNEARWDAGDVDGAEIIAEYRQRAIDRETAARDKTIAELTGKLNREIEGHDFVKRDLEAHLLAAEQSANFHRERGITLLDAKWLDPECHEGCQSLVFKNEIADLRAQLAESRDALEGCSRLLRLVGTTWTDESDAHKIAYREADTADRIIGAIDAAREAARKEGET